MSVSWSPDSKTLASASWDKTIRLWDPVTGKQMRSYAGCPDWVWSVSWSPNGKTFASAGVDETIRLWEEASGKEIRTCKGHKGRVLTVAWSPDGKALAAAGDDKAVRLWDPSTGKEIRFCTGHEGWIWSVAWSPDGRTLASASYDHTIRFWDPATGKEIRSFALNDCSVESIAFSPDGRRLASANSDTTILIWAVPSVPLEERKRSADELSGVWTDLGSEDAARADRALWTLVAVREQSVALLKEQLAPVPRDPKRAEKLATLVADLDSDDFGVRQNASAELGKLGGLAEAALRKALKNEPSVEAKRRIVALLDQLDRNPWPGLPLQSWRGVAVLERIGNAEALQVLRALAEGAPDARLTQEASAALERLRKQQAESRK
jgi:dipeptidyl aminopeptidase/acylaminoacyl peptidase